MIEFIEILIIAIAQGVCEFLPISSSGHIAVINHLFERFGEPLAEGSDEFIKLNVLLHIGSLIAVLIVFRKRILDMFGKDWRLIPKIIVATIPAVIVGLTVKKYCPWIETHLPLISGSFVITGILLLLTLRCSEGEKTCSTMSWIDALIIGCSQAFAILPGVSRSGMTIVTGLFCRLKREESAAFSFILSIPVIAGAGILEAKDMLQDASGPQKISDGLLFLGAGISCLAGILALLFLVNWLKNGKLWYFAIWVFIMAPITLVLACLPMPNNVPSPSGDTFIYELEEGQTTKDITSPHSSPSQREEGTEKASPLDLPPAEEDEEIKALREKVLAEEQAKELALIEEERKIVPLVEKPETLIPLHPDQRIWITPERKSVVLIGRVVLREGLLELLACRVGTKEHESILSVRVEPNLVHAALLAVNARQGKPMQTSPVFVPASGDRIGMTLHWKDESGKQQESPAQDWVWDMSKSPEEAKLPMTTHWVFSGSRMYHDDEGKSRYVADESGELFGLSNFVGSILDVPIQSSADNSQLQFGCFTERIPPLETPVTVVLTPVQ